MNCSEMMALIDVPEELLQPEEQQQLQAHLAGCPECAGLAAALRDSLHTFQSAPDLQPRPQAWAKFERDLAALQAEQPLSGWPRQASAGQAAASATPRSTRAPIMGTGARPRTEASASSVQVDVAVKGSAEQRPRGAFSTLARGAFASTLVLGLAIMSLTAVPSMMKTDSQGGAAAVATGSEFTTKGTFQPVLDLQTTTEHIAPTDGKVTLFTTENASDVGVGDGLLFRFNVQGGGHLVLLERTPDHRLSVIFRRQGLDTTVDGGSVLEITGDNGQLLRYVPSGVPGDYTYLAVLSRQRLNLGPAGLDALWNRYAEVKVSPLHTTPSLDYSLDSLEIHFDPSLVHEPSAHDQAVSHPDEDRK